MTGSDLSLETLFDIGDQLKGKRLENKAKSKEDFIVDHLRDEKGKLQIINFSHCPYFSSPQITKSKQHSILLL